MRSDNKYLKLILVFSLLGILVSGWLLSIHIRFSTGQATLTESCALPGMGSSEGCANVAVSDYSDVFGIPLAAIAMGYYFTLVILVFWAMRNFQAALEPLYVSYFLSTLSIIVTVVMFSISRFVLKSFCIGCAMLWLINLSIWPAFVVHLQLSWARALAANLELLRHKALSLKKERVVASLAVGFVCVLVFAVIGAAAKGLQGQEANVDTSSVIKDFQEAPQVFLTAEAIGGPSAKGLKGEGNVPVMEIVEFADFQCPGCRVAAQFLKPFVRKHGNKVRLTFRNFPLDGSCNPHAPGGRHLMACTAARYGICAGRQGKFYEMHDQIYDKQDSLSPSMLEETASQIGLDKSSLESCLKDPETENQLQQEMNWGETIQLNSTPTIVINGRRLAGARSPQELEALLEHLEKSK